MDGEDDKIYYFFTEVSVEYEFFGKLLIPRVARVCKVSARHEPSAQSSSTPPRPVCSCYCTYRSTATSFHYLMIFIHI